MNYFKCTEGAVSEEEKTVWIYSLERDGELQYVAGIHL